MRLIIKNAILRINLTVHGAALPTPNKKKKEEKKKEDEENKSWERRKNIGDKIYSGRKELQNAPPLIQLSRVTEG